VHQAGDHREDSGLTPFAKHFECRGSTLRQHKSPPPALFQDARLFGKPFTLTRRRALPVFAGVQLMPFLVALVAKDCRWAKESYLNLMSRSTSKGEKPPQNGCREPRRDALSGR